MNTHSQTSFTPFTQLIQQPSSIQAIFIADLHLSADTPQLNCAFTELLYQLTTLSNLQALYILGDWLDGWIGDDDYLSLNEQQKHHHWLHPILQALQTLRITTQIFVMHGNRDFTIRQGLCDVFGGKLITEPYFVKAHGMTYRLEHGDKLCSDDKHYQRYRRIIRNPIISWLLLKQPLNKRQQLAQKIKAKSTQDKTQKDWQIMDVSPKTVNDALASCDVLLHGHTHRPNIHPNNGKKRLVLGDWHHQQRQVSAVIGALTDDGIGLYEFLWVDK